MTRGHGQDRELEVAEGMSWLSARGVGIAEIARRYRTQQSEVVRLLRSLSEIKQGEASALLQPLALRALASLAQLDAPCAQPRPGGNAWAERMSRARRMARGTIPCSEQTAQALSALASALRPIEG